MATQIPQFILQDLIPYFARVKQRLVASDTQSPAVEEEESEEFKEAEDDGAASCTSAEQESVFDGAEDTASTSPSEVGLVNPPAVVPAAGIWYTRKDLTDLLSFIAQRVSLEHLQKLHIAAGLGPVVISRLDILTLKACVVSGARHTFQEDHRCLRCDRQLCSSCRHSILSQCTRFASPDSAALVGCHRHNSIAASRISSTCHNTACIDNHPITTHRCECMEKLLSATNVRNMEIDGFYHCEECLTYSLADMRVHNMTRLEFITPQGLEILAYKCACGNPAAAELPRLCKICLGVCMPYTLNAFDTFSVPGQMPRVAMKGLNPVNGGGEGQAGWNNGEVLWWVNAS